MCPQEFLSYFFLVFHQKSTKHGLKWKLASLSTYRAFEHHPKLHSFVVRCRRSSLLSPRKFSNFRYYNFWKFIIFVLHGQYVYQMKAGNILHSNLTWKNRICYEKICVKWVFQNFCLIFDCIFFSKLKFFKKIIRQSPIFMIVTWFRHEKKNLHES